MRGRQLKKLAVFFVFTIFAFCSLFAMTNVQAAIDTNREIEVTIAADPVSNNLNLNGFSDLLKSKLNSMYGIPTDKVHVNVSESAAVSSSMEWNIFDHTNYAAYQTDTQTSRIDLFSWDYNNLMRNYHVVLADDVINFYGYGSPAYKDFLYAPNNNANNKIFKFTLDEMIVDYHTAEGAGFLFNAKYTYNSNSDRRLSGYVVLIGSSYVNLYRLDNIDLISFKNENYLTLNSVASYVGSSGSAWGGTVYNLAQVAKPSPSNGTQRYLKLVASPSAVSFYQFTDTTYGTVKNKIFDNIALSTSYNTFGFGPIACYSSHGCWSLTNVAFSGLQMSEDTSVSFSDLVKSISWNYADSLRIVANVDNDGVSDFGSTPSLSTILYYMLNNNAHYVGWGYNNPISIGGYNTVSAQTNGFISRNNNRGTFINRSDASSDSLDEGAQALAVYIGGQLGLDQTIEKPLLNTEFLGNGQVKVTTPDTLTSLGNPIGAYQWRYIDVANGTWQNVNNGSTNSTNFTFAAGTYNYVSLRIQDSLTLLWSEYSIAYVANDSSAPPIAQFTLDTNELMPDTAIESLRTGTSVIAEDCSYHPAGEQLTNWEWKVYNSTLVEQTDMAKTYTNLTTPESISFDFSGKPAGTYTLKLRVKKGASVWSSYYTQDVIIYKESASVTITPTNPPDGGVKAYVGTESIAFNIASSGSTITAYRVIKLPVSSGSAIVGDWTKTNASSVNGTGSVSGGTYDVYIQAKDALGNSKTLLFGRFLASYTVTFKDFEGNTLKTETVIHGNAATAPADVPARIGYDFAGWSTAFSNVSSNLTVNAQYDLHVVNITITAQADSKTYGDTDPAGFDYTVTSGSLIDGVPLSGSLSRAAGENAGAYAIGQNTLTHANNPNYIITYIGADFTIDKKALTITAVDKTKIYGNSDPALTVSFSGFAAGDDSRDLTGLSISRAAGENTGNYTITASGAVNGNYAISYSAGTFSITKRNLTITADNASKTYGQLDPEFSVHYSGFATGDDENDIGDVIISRVVGESARTYAIAPSGATSDNYNFIYVNGILTINKQALAIIADNKTKEYGESDSVLTVTYNGFVNSDDASDLTGLSITRAAGENAGNYTITASGAVNSNYTISYTAGTYAITKKALAITAVDKTKTYGETDPALTATFEGFIDGEDSSDLTGLAITREAGENAGTYDITASGAVNGNYSITYATGTFTISKKALVITADDKSKIYGATDPALTVSYDGFIDGDDSSALTGLSISREAGADVGTYDITASGAVSGNYSISYVGGTLTITVKALVITADDKTKTYGDLDPLLTATITGFENGDDISDLPGLAISREAGADAGTYTITASGAVNTNYTISYEDGLFTITKKSLKITADDKTKSYGSSNPALTATFDGFANGDDESDLTGLSISREAGENFGTYTITASGAVNGNYTITYETGTFTITKKALTIAADNKSKTYGATDPALTATIYGFESGDDSSDLPGLTITRAAGANAGTYTITASGAVNSNYSITYATGTFTINRKALVISADDKTKIYGSDDPELTAYFNGFTNGDGRDDLQGLVYSRIAGEDAGVYAIKVSGAVNNNYAFTYVDGKMTITRKTLTITAENKIKTYGDSDPAFTASFAGLANGDTGEEITGIAFARTAGEGAGKYTITASGAVSSNYAIDYAAGNLTVTRKALVITADDKAKSYGDSDPVLTASFNGLANGDKPEDVKGLAISRATGENIGTYAIKASNATSANYTITFENGTFTIAAQVLVIKADSKTKTYGDSDPDLTITFEGFKNGDDSSDITGLAISRAEGENAGTYDITVSGAVNDNYTISYEKGTLTIEKKALAIKADDKKKTYGDSDPALTATFTGFANGDDNTDLTGLAISRVAGENAGTYAITASGAANGNYTITYTAGTLTIEKKDGLVINPDKEPSGEITLDDILNSDNDGEAVFQFEGGDLNIPTGLLEDIIGDDLDATIEIILEENDEENDELQDLRDANEDMGIITTFDLSIIKKYSDGTEEIIEDFSGDFEITIQLTQEQIEQMEANQVYEVYAYDEESKIFTPMKAVYDPETKTMVFKSKNSCKFVLGLKATANPGTPTKPVEPEVTEKPDDSGNPQTSDSFPILALAAIILAAIVGLGIRGQFNWGNPS
ncbi:MAG: MBG domain-containing protein [Saccharofermentanales bacterium]